MMIQAMHTAQNASTTPTHKRAKPITVDHPAGD
jgi:hypothetical protein